MAIVATALVVLVVAIHVYIVILEMFLWRTAARDAGRSAPIRHSPTGPRRWPPTRGSTTGSSWPASSGGLIAADPIGFQVKSSSSAASWSPACTAPRRSAAGSWSCRPSRRYLPLRAVVAAANLG